MNRREFLHTTAQGVALSGGITFMSSSTGGAAVSDSTPPEHAYASWRPASPRRLSDRTRELARMALAGEHGRSMREAGFGFDDASIIGMSANMRYALATRFVAEQAPLRLLSGERIVGSATLLEAPAHRVPVAGVSSVSHTTLGFAKALKLGYSGIRRQIEARIARREPTGATTPGLGELLCDVPGGHAIQGHPAAGWWWEAAPREVYDTLPITVACQARLDRTGAYNILAANRCKDSRSHWELYTEADNGELSVYAPGLEPAIIRSGRVVTDGQWHDLSASISCNRVEIRVDGQLALSQAVVSSGFNGTGGGGLWFGAYPPGGLGCGGSLARVRIQRGIENDVDTEPLGDWRIQANTQDALLQDSSTAANHAKPVYPQDDLLESMLVCLDAAAVWHKRHMDRLDELIQAATGDERTGWERVREALRHVPEQPPATFHEAVQSLWFTYAFLRLMGNWPGIGRIDEMLGPYLDADLEAGRITLDEAREILAHFWIKGCEWIGAFDTPGSGDAQHYQNIILGGVNAEGVEVTNHVTYLVLDIVEELHISDFPIAVRLNPHSPRQLLERMADVQRHGGGIVAAYNEDVVIGGLVKFGYPVEEARTFTNDGCWETLIPGRTTFIYAPFDMLVLLHKTLGLTDSSAPTPDYPDFNTLYGAFLERLREQVKGHHAWADGWALNGTVAPLVSIFVEDCIERGRGYHDRGARYTVGACHAGRIANVANSLHVLNRLVYEERRVTLPDFIAILGEDWNGQESLRMEVSNRFTFYGNDDDAADAMMQRVFNDFTAIVAETRERHGVLRPAGISTFGREIEWSLPESHRKATADGHHAGAVLATNCSPSPGTDTEGPTAVLKSYCKLDFTRSPNGATVELKVHPDTVRGDRGRDALVALMRGFVDMGGWFLHIDVVDSAMLLDAQRHPERYPNLSVRVAGWSARFATLNKPWQDMIIARTQQYVS